MATDAKVDEERGAIFPAILELKAETIQVEGKPVRLSPGMNVTAEIRTGRRRVLDYMLAPMQAAVNESFRER